MFDSAESTVPKKILNIHNKKNFIHSEPIVLDQIRKCFSEKLPDISLSLSDNSILDLAIWITNSPCIGCRDVITEYLKYLQLKLSLVNLRLILCFSSLFCDRQGEPEKTLDAIKDWVLNLVEMKISVILSSIIVSKIVPKPKEIFVKKIQKREERDLHSLTYMRKLKLKILSTKTTTRFNVFSNNEILSKDNTFTGIPENGLVYFSLTLSDKHHLSKLTPTMGLFVRLFTCLFVLGYPRARRTKKIPNLRLPLTRCICYFVTI